MKSPVGVSISPRIPRSICSKAMDKARRADLEKACWDKTEWIEK